MEKAALVKETAEQEAEPVSVEEEIIVETVAEAVIETEEVAEAAPAEVSAEEELAVMDEDALLEQLLKEEEVKAEETTEEEGEEEEEEEEEVSEGFEFILATDAQSDRSSQIRFAEQTICFSRVKTPGVPLIELELCLLQKIERLSVSLIPDAGIRQQAERVRLKQ